MKPQNDQKIHRFTLDNLIMVLDSCNGKILQIRKPKALHVVQLEPFAILSFMTKPQPQFFLGINYHSHLGSFIDLPVLIGTQVTR